MWEKSDKFNHPFNMWRLATSCEEGRLKYGIDWAALYGGGRSAGGKSVNPRECNT